MPMEVSNIIDPIVQDLRKELSPLNSIYHNFAQYEVLAGFQEGFFLSVFAPSRVQHLIPSSFKSFPVQFIPTQEQLVLDLDLPIDVSSTLHNLYV